MAEEAMGMRMNDLDRQRLGLAVRSGELAMMQLSQVSRCLTIALLSFMKGDTEEAIKQTGEISDRLNEAEAKMQVMREMVEAIDNAGE